MKNKFVKIVSTGSFLPKNVVDNAQLEKNLEDTDSWIFVKTGIHQRHIAGKEDSVFSMAHQASMKALGGANIDRLDIIIVATTTADQCFPSIACQLQSSLNMGHGYPAFDVSAACSGFSYALLLAERLLIAKGHGNALVVGSEMMSRIVNWRDRSTCVLFGDGAAATVLSVSSQPGIVHTDVGADGSNSQLIYTTPLWKKLRPVIKMNGSELFRNAVNILAEKCLALLKKCGKLISDIDWIVPHQSNMRIIECMARKLGFSMEKVIITIEKHANTSSASVPIALDCSLKEGKIKVGDCVIIATFGAGLVWGFSLIYIYIYINHVC